VDELFRGSGGAEEEPIANSHFEKSKLATPKDVAKAKEVYLESIQRGKPYRVYGRAIYHFILNDQCKAVEFSAEVTLHSIEQAEKTDLGDHTNNETTTAADESNAAAALKEALTFKDNDDAKGKTKSSVVVH
jgi:hypothetical protein